MISSNKSKGLFDRWKTHDDSCNVPRENNKKNKKVSPIELLLLHSLRYLGRGWTFDDMCNVTYISRDVHRKFFHQFVKFGALVLYPIWNDKTLIRFDEFMSNLCDGNFVDDKMDFKLRTRQGTSQSDDEQGCADRTLVLTGAYMIVDNGYLEWSTTVPALKLSCNRLELRFSQWLLESMRKDVECTFGILKGRWRILKTGIRLHNTEIPFAIRRLMDPNGTDEYQRPPVELSDNEEGEDDDANNNRNYRNPNKNCEATTGRRFQLGRIQSGTAVNELNLFQFRSLLIENFTIRSHARDLHWPKRLACSSPRNLPALIAA
ncbi:Plant transposon protein [Fragilaria crotonensis]|nr:Plant transposon protein [Fragilaria crotonensis]